MAGGGEVEISDVTANGSAAKQPLVLADANDEIAEEEESQPSSFWGMYREGTSTEKKMILGGFFCTCCSGLSVPGMVFLFDDIFRALFSPDGDSIPRAWAVFWKFAALSSFTATCTTIGFSCITISADRIVARLRVQFFKTLMNRNVGWYDTHRMSEFSTRLTQDAHDMKLGMGRKVAIVMMSFVMGPGGLGMAFYKDWRLSSVLIVFLPFIICLVLPAINSMMAAAKNIAPLTASAGGVAETTIRAVQTVAAFNGFERELKRYDDMLGEVESGGITMGKARACMAGTIEPSLFLLQGVAFVVGTFWMLESYANNCWHPVTGDTSGCYQGGTIMSVLTGVMMGGGSLVFGVQQLGELTLARVAAGRFYQIIDEPAAFEMDIGEQVSHADMKGAITFKEVTFSYPTRLDTKALDCVSYTIESGQSVAFVGPSGSGKSTCVGLLMRFYDPMAGTILLDGRDIRSLNLKQMRACFGLVQQEPILFAGTIRSNIANGKEGASKEEVIAAAKIAAAHAFITEKDNDYDTEVGDRGVTLSGGQKQRIAIARAMIRQPKVLLLDEATSALDTESEVLVMQAIEEIVGKQSSGENQMTTIMIAHRLSTVKICDKIFVMDASKLMEQGSHAELLKKEGGLYKQLVELQQIGSAQGPLAASHRDISAQLKLNRGESNFELPALVQKRTSQRSANVNKSLSKRNSFHLLEVDPIASTQSSVRVRKTEEVDNAKVVEEEEEKEVPPEDEQEKEVSVTRLWELAGNAKTWMIIAICSAIPQSAGSPVLGSITGRIITALSDPPVRFIHNTTKEFPCFGLPECVLEESHDPEATWATVRQLTTLLVSLSFVSALATAITFSGTAFFSEAITRSVRRDTFKAILRQEISFFDLRSANMLTDRLAHEAPQIKTFAGAPITGLVRAIGTCIVTLFIVFSYDVALPLTIIAISPFMLYGSIYFGRQMKKQNETRGGPMVSEAMGNIRTVAAFNLQDEMCASYDTMLAAEVQEDKRQNIVQGFMQGYMDVCRTMMYGVTVVAGAYYIQWQWTSPAAVFPVLYTIMSALQSAASAYTEYTAESGRGSHALKHVFNTIDRKPLIDAYMEGGDRPEASMGILSFKDVVFAYPSQAHNTIFNGFSLDIKSGQNVAFVGPSGSGKSTTVRLILRFYDPGAGSVCFDGHDVRSLNLTWLRSQMGLVQQEPVLFSGTIADNIRYGKPDATDEEIKEAAKAANAYSFIMNPEMFPAGFETDVGEMGGQTSGGQKQRIAIARCMVRLPKVLLLDEATSALDSVSEQVVQEAIDRLFQEQNCTKVTIAHRLSTIQNCDLICVVYEGKVVEKGTHDELIGIANGQYARLVERQKL